MAARQEDVKRLDLQSTVGVMPAFEPTEVQSDMGLMIYNPDGSLDILPDHQEDDQSIAVHHDKATADTWNENLAEKLNVSERMLIAHRLCEFLDIDIEARREHFERLKQGMDLLGVSRPTQADSEAPFEGASEVTHPMIAEAVTQFQARAIEELMPAAGPVKSSIVGKADEARKAQASRIEDYMNFQLTEQDEQHFWHTDQMLFYLGLSGTAFKKAQRDPITGMIVSRFVKDIDFIVPYNAQDLHSAPRYCHRYRLWENDIRRAKQAGTFLESARMPVPGTTPDNSDGRDRTQFEDRADDLAQVDHPDDTVSTFLEYHIDYRMPWDQIEDIAPPYIVTVDKENEEVLAVRRNWRQNDQTKRKRMWFSMYRYLPGIGFYGMGMLHMVGNLAIAASGAMRALLDSAAFANFQGGFKLKVTNMSGVMRLSPGQWKDVDCSIEDISKMFYTPPFKEPSPALAQMLQLMVEEGRRYLSTTENMVGDASNTGPVGTTLALIEQGSKVFSAIHKRMHVSARREYKMLAELNFEFMTEDEYPYEIEGESRQILRQDFDGRVDVLPVSDPNIWSSTQRIAQAQAVVEVMASDPQLYGVEERREAHRRLFAALKVPDADGLLPDKVDRRMDPVAENMSFMVGKAVKAWAEQDHDAHMTIHNNFSAKMAAENPDLVAELEPVMIAHIREHLALKYRQEIEASLGMPLPPFDLMGHNDDEELPEEVEVALSQAVAQRLQPPPPPPPPAPDPEEQAAQAQADAVAKAAEDAADAKTVGELERKGAIATADLSQKKQAFEAEEARKQAAFDAEQARSRQAFDLEQRQTTTREAVETRAQMLTRLSKSRDQQAQTKAKVESVKAGAEAKSKSKPKPKPKGK